MNLKTRIGVGALAMIAILSTVACTGSSILTTLEAIIAAADTAVGVLQATGTIPPQTGGLVVDYLAIVSKDASATTTELASSDTLAIKDTKIAEIWANSVAPQIPGAPPALLASLQAVEAAVNQFLGGSSVVLNAESTSTVVQTPEFRVRAAFAIPPAIGGLVVRPSLFQRFELRRMRHHADALVKKLGK